MGSSRHVAKRYARTTTAQQREDGLKKTRIYPWTKRKRKSLIGLPPSSGCHSHHMGYTQTHILTNTHILLAWSLHSDQRSAWPPGAVGMVVFSPPWIWFSSFSLHKFPASSTPRSSQGCSCSVAQSCLILCNPIDCSTLGFPVLHHLLEFAETHVYWFSDSIQPSCPLLSPCPPALNLSQHQGLFQWVGSLHQVVKYWSFSISSFQWIFRDDIL